jgi:energy-coupling factor transporter ATP-binding protein EcfA2
MCGILRLLYRYLVMPGRAYTLDEIQVQPNVLHWDEFTEMFSGSYEQGEHVAIVGPTGGGKTTIGLSICKLIGQRRTKDRRPARVTVLCYKPRDDTMRQVLPESEWPVIKKWPPGYGEEHCIVWVRGGKSSTERKHRQVAVFRPLLDTMYREGGQAVYIPEAAHFERKPPDGLGMGGMMTEFWSSARSNKLAIIADTQRPRWVTRSMWTEPSWLIICRPEDDDDLREVAKLSGEKMAVLNTVPHLGPYEFLCIRRQRHAQRELYVSRVDVTRNKRSKEAA